MRRIVNAVLLLFACCATASAQPLSRYATTAEALVAAPVFFHGKQIAVRRQAESSGRYYRLTGTAKPVLVFWRESPVMREDVEIRGDFVDLGRLQQDDTRLSGIDVNDVVATYAHGMWPPRDQVFLILGATTVDSPLPAEPTIRALALAPERYLGKGVSVVGRFRAANLYADLPQGAGTKGQWDFVIQAGDAAIWISGVRPRGKGFDLDTHSKIDTGRWLRVTGIVRRDGALPWIAATTVAVSAAVADMPETSEEPRRRAEPEPPPRVVFSAPSDGETDAERGGPIRIQFSRDMEEKSFKGRVRLSYVGPTPPGAPAEPPSFTLQYVPGSRGLELKLASPLDRFRTVKIELLDGIVSAIDNQPLAPASVTFTTGG